MFANEEGMDEKDKEKVEIEEEKQKLQSGTICLLNPAFSRFIN